MSLSLDIVDFYQALGFEVTHLQTHPNPYAALKFGDIDLQLFELKLLDPTTSISTCYIVTGRVDELYAAFRGGLNSCLERSLLGASHGSAKPASESREAWQEYSAMHDTG